MSLDATRTYIVPDQTAQVARAIFPKGNPVMRLFDDLHMVVADRDFADLFPARGQPAEAPVRLALATLLQFMEGLTDRQGKYLLCLELTDVGFDPTVLSEFRTRLLAHACARARSAGSTPCSRWRRRTTRVKAGGRQGSELDARPRGHARHEPAGGRRGNAASRSECAGDHGARLAVGAHDAGVGRPVRAPRQ